jgi:hypothetical protein
MFSKKSDPLPLVDRLKALRAAIHAAMEEYQIPSTAAVPVLEDIALTLKMAHAMSAPLPSARPKVWSGNVPEKKSILDLAKRIAG